MENFYIFLQIVLQKMQVVKSCENILKITIYYDILKILPQTLQ